MAQAGTCQPHHGQPDWRGEGPAFYHCDDLRDDQRVKTATASLQDAGINAVSYVSEGTAHEFHTWRRCLYEFAQLLFQ